MRIAPVSLALALGCIPELEARMEHTGAATGDTGADPTCHEPDQPTWEGWGEGFFVTWCQSCHSRTSPGRAGAPVGVDFDTADDVHRQAAAIRRTVLDARSMPLGGGLDEETRTALDSLLRCGP